MPIPTFFSERKPTKESQRWVRARTAIVCCLPLMLLFSASLEVFGQDEESALESLRNRLGGGEAVSGAFRETTPGNYIFLPSAEGVALRVSNPDRIAAGAAGPRLKVSGKLLEGGAFEVSEYKLDLQREKLAGDLDPGLAQTLSDFETRINAMLRPGAMSVIERTPDPDSTLGRAERDAKQRLASLYQEALEAGDSRKHDQVIRSWSNIRQELKAIYDTFDNYPPWSYRRVYRNAGAVVALAVPGENRAICSGVLVGEDLVLTAGHCFERHDPTDLEVWFDYAQDRDSRLRKKAFKIEALVAPSVQKRKLFQERKFGSELYDFAIVRFGLGDASALPLSPHASCAVRPPEAAPADVKAEWEGRCVRKPQCLRKYPMRRGRPLYVIGYPRGEPETVHDNGRVYLPYRIHKNELRELQLEIEADYLGHEDRAQIVKDFTDSYQADSSGVRYHLFDVRYGSQPMMGIVADTFKGNSGSPVFDREGHCVEGILLGGAQDRGRRLTASWLEHESVLPMTAILEDLSRYDDTRVLVEGGALVIP